MLRFRRFLRLRRSLIGLVLLAIATSFAVPSSLPTALAKESDKKAEKQSSSKAKKAQAKKKARAKKLARKFKYILPMPLEDLGRDYKVRLIYFVPTDKEAKKNYRKKIDVLMQVVADLYRRNLAAHKINSRGLDFEFDEEGDVVVHLIEGDKPSVFYTGEPFSVQRLLESTKQEVLFKLGNPVGRACLIFSEAGGIAEAQPAYPYCGFAMVSGDMLRDEITATSIEKQVAGFFDTRPYRARGEKKGKPLNTERQVSNGVLAHELGHIFFMLHDTRKKDLNIMASGYHNLAQMYDKRAAKKMPVRFSEEHARIASATRFLSEEFDEKDTTVPKIDFKVVRQPPGGQHDVEFKIKLRDAGGLHSVILMQRGGGGIDAFMGGSSLEGKKYDKTVTFQSPHKLLTDQPLVYIINVMDKNGNCAQAIQQSSVGPAIKEKRGSGSGQKKKKKSRSSGRAL